MKLAFLGLGVMGYPMAGHLADKSSYKVTVYNRTIEKAVAWQKEHPEHHYHKTISGAVRDADFVFMCVGDDPDVAKIALDPKEGALVHMKAGSVLIDHTTCSATMAKQVAAFAADRKIGFLDAPVSGGQSGAEKGMLSIMVGGDKAIFDRVEPILTHYAKACRLIGAVSSGQLAKMVNQICISGVLQGLSEAVAFGQNAGLDMEAVLEVISKGAAGSWQMENRGKTMIANKFDYGFALDWMRKDLRICLEEARQNGSQLPITAVIDQFYAKLQADGLGRQDTSSLVQLLRKS